MIKRLQRSKPPRLQGGVGLNTLVIIDEAHRLAPRQMPEDGEDARGVRSQLIDAVRTTRNMVLAGCFSQTLSSLHQEILQQLASHFLVRSA